MIYFFVFLGVVLAGVVIWMVIAGQKRDEAWMQLATETGAEFIKGGFMRASQVRARYKEWTITLDTHSVPSGDSNDTYTRITAPIQNKSGIQFTVSHRGLVSKLDKALGAKEIATGDAEFDRDYFIRGRDDAQVQAVFSNLRIRQLVESQRSLRFGVMQGDALVFEAQGVIRDVERLRSLFELFRVTLDQLNGGQ